jgi:16S rRNA (guanine527-N7)-methyltransferase
LSASELGIDLSVEKLEKFAVFADELKKWNRKINLTSITSDSEIAVKHFADSLTLLKVIGENGSLLDIGSGGGFPSIPVKIVLPMLYVVSVDAVEKKILFQRHLARMLGLDNFFPIHARCEELTTMYAESFDWIVSRALSDITAFVKLALPFLHRDGRIIAMKGKRGGEEAASAIPGLAEAGVAVVDIMEIKLPVTGDLRTLVVMKKKRNESVDNIQKNEYLK